MFLLITAPWFIAVSMKIPESAVFYLDTTVTPVKYTGELKMGIKQEPGKYISTFEEFVGKWQQLVQYAVNDQK